MKFNRKSVLLLQLLAAINSHAAAQSNLVSWGDSYGGFAPVTTNTVSSVSCGHACLALMKDRSLLSWLVQLSTMQNGLPITKFFSKSLTVMSTF